jgi:hypothetical protein
VRPWGRVRLDDLSASGPIAGAVGAEEPFSFPWPGPGNSEGPVDPDLWTEEVPARDESFRRGRIVELLTTSPWPGPGDSEA